MTIQGAMKELVNLLNADDIPTYYKGGIKKVIETIDDYIDGKDDYIKRRTEPQTFICPIQNDYEALIEDEPQTDNGIGCSRCEGRFDCYDRDMPHAVRCNNYGKVTDEPQTERSE